MVAKARLRAGLKRRMDLAISPTDGETFLREVDEELRKERINNFVTRYAWALIAGAIVVLAAIGGLIWWNGHRQDVQARQGQTLLEALDRMEAGNRNAALPKLAELAQSRTDGYRAAALFARANAQLDANQVPAAIATLRTIANDEDLAEPYRQVALVRQTSLEFDHLQPQVVIQRLQPLAQPGKAWFGTAGEMVGIAQLKLHRPDLAGPLFARIGRDETVPPSIRARAIQMAGSLGIDATPPQAEAPQAAAPQAAPVQAAPVQAPSQPGAAAPAQPSAPAATRNSQ
jgi:hypothetical protein